MSSVKIVSRSGLVWNMALFCLLQVIFLHVVTEVHQGQSALNLQSIRGFLLQMIPLLGLTVATIYSVLQLKKVSLVFFPIHSLLIAWFSAQIFQTGLDKIVLILLFAYIVLSYVMFMMWKLELGEAAFRPGYGKRSLYRFLEYDIQIELSSGGQSLAEGKLSNWDEFSFFVHLGEGKPHRMSRFVDVNIQLRENSFQTKAKLVSHGPHGVGLRVVEESSLASRDWKSFYDIIQSRGYINRFA